MTSLEFLVFSFALGSNQAVGEPAQEHQGFYIRMHDGKEYLGS